MGNRTCSLSKLEEHELPREVRLLLLYENVAHVVQQDPDIKEPLLSLAHNIYRLMNLKCAGYAQELYIADSLQIRNMLLAKLNLLPELQFWCKTNWNRKLILQLNSTLHLNTDLECECVMHKLILLPADSGSHSTCTACSQ